MILIFGEICFDEKIIEVAWSVDTHNRFVKSHIIFVSFPIMQVSDRCVVSLADDGDRKVGGVVSDVDDGLSVAWFWRRPSSFRIRVEDVLEGLDEQWGNVIVGVSSLAEVGVELFYVLVSHHGVAV